ncbi:MAG: phosphoglucosamine mutase [Oscillospiraceae bacterium]|jgi:phosphoglucosamine mutase|nr:phosphoglucosamine mutase [Oscillospiraceae bacterium]
MGKYFGTDGIRGIANTELSAILAARVGFAAAVAVGAATGRPPRVIIGKDTRISGDMIEAGLSAGLSAGGADITQLGILPTPAVAFLARVRKSDLGIVISASHNPFEHNGIKFFSGDGYKLSDRLEAEIERLADSPDELRTFAKTHGQIGRIRRDEHSDEKTYIDWLLSYGTEDLTTLRVAVDCANGAAYRTARVLFARLGISADVFFDEPNGVNINDGCGSTHLNALRGLMDGGGYDAGVAFDGDADRCLFLDESGGEIDGDAVLAVCADDMLSRGELDGGLVVGTVMTNSGFREYADARGLTLLISDVGDRSVLELMKSSGAVLGGETSGHTIFHSDATTGDGELTAVKFLSVLARSGKKASELAAIFPKYPQVIVNVSVDNAAKPTVMRSEPLLNAVADAESKLAGRGRVLVRPSGTEPLIRVTVEAPTREYAESLANKIAAAIA